MRKKRPGARTVRQLRTFNPKPGAWQKQEAVDQATLPPASGAADFEQLIAKVGEVILNHYSRDDTPVADLLAAVLT